MSLVTEESTTGIDVFLDHYERLQGRASGAWPSWLEELRGRAIARFTELGMPTRRQEEWRFTNVAPLAEIPFEAVGQEPAAVPAETLGRLAMLGPDSPRAVLVDGRFVPELSSAEALPEGVLLGGLAELLTSRPELVEPHLGRHAAFDEHTFVALNTASFEDGVVLYVPRGVVIEEPIHVVHLWSDQQRPRVAHPRILAVIDRHAAVSVVQRYAAAGESLDFTNAVTEVVLGENASLDHYKLQRESPAAMHLASTQVRQERDSSFASHFISLGGKLVRNEISVLLAAENCSATLNGLYVAGGRQHVDSRTRIDHAKPHCESHELYKGILDDRAEGVFNGKIYVHPDAQKTDAKQTNQALLLSDDATINTKPQLEIFADDVKCTHGATVGQLDSEALFYLRSRGIANDMARSLLTYAFANDVVSRIRVGAVRSELEEILLAGRGLPTLDVLEEMR